MDFTIKPIVTEKATRLTDKLNRYTFRVSPEANKHQINGVKVVNVNTAVVRGKNKSRWTKSGLLRGKTAAYKKAFITVGEGQTIDFYSNI